MRTYLYLKNQLIICFNSSFLLLIYKMNKMF